MEIFIKIILWIVLSLVMVRLYNKGRRLPNINPKMILASLAIIYAILAMLGLIFQHMSFNTYAKDLAIYTQAIKSWNLFSPILGRSLMAEHFSPILFLLIPLGKIINSPYLLFLIQTTLLILPIFPLYKIAKHFKMDDWPALLIVFIYLNFYFVRAMTISGFHVELFMPFLILLLVGAFLANQIRWFWIWLIACLLIKEDVAFYLAAWFAVLSITFKQNRKLSILATLVCFILGIVAITSLLPANQGVYPHFGNWQVFGKGLFGIIFGALFHPLLSIAVFFKTSTWSLLLPLLGLPLITGWGWAMLPTLWVQLASSSSTQSLLGSYYAAPVIPLLMVALIAGWKKFEQWSLAKENHKKWVIVVLAFLIIFNLHWIPWQKVKKEHVQLAKIVNKMPKEGIIFAQANIAPHISNSHRVRVLGMNSFKDNPDVIIFHIKGNIWPFSRTRYLKAINQIRFNTNYKLWKDEAGAQIYIRTNQSK